MKNRLIRIVLSVLYLWGLNTPAWAQPFVSSDPEPTYLVEARARNGATGYEGVLFTPADPAPGNATTQLNPTGAPAWTYNQFHNFSFQFDPTTGNAIWQIDFNRDGDFLDAEESTNSTSPTLVNRGFQYINVWMQGNNVPALTVTVQNLTVNGVNFGTYSSTGSPPTSVLFEETSGTFSNITVTGSVRFSGGSGQERPRMYIRMGALVVLPVRLLGFSVDATESGREIRWNVEAEDGVDYYEIERSQDGRAFQSIGRVPAKNQSGSYQYAFTDRQALTGKVFYRLKTVDVDGRFVFSNILVREADLNGSLFRFYPNPAKGSFSILRKGSGTATLQVFQLDGKLRLQKTIAYASENISLEGLAPGIYVVLLRTNSGDFRDRLVVQ